jgi:hypothetical protein
VSWCPPRPAAQSTPPHVFIRFPLQLFGPETAAQATAVIRPVVRDGGQRLVVDNPLWEVTQEGRAAALGRSYMGLLR